jgi:Concanavalin A-like lectin/glucanases superfamily
MLAGVFGASCQRARPDLGSVSLALTLPSGSHINQVHYVIHAGMPGGIADVSGNINTTDQSATPTAFVSFPASTGDTVTLTADTTGMPPIHCSGVGASFTVLAGQQAEAAIVLMCGGGQAAGTGNNGNVHINGTVSEIGGTGDNCPQVTSWTVSPFETSAPTGTIDVTADATDMDPGETATLTFAWAPAGKFTSATGKTNTYHCLVAGPDTITLSVTDTHMPSACTETVSFPVNCVAMGTAGAGGTSDGAAGGTSDGAAGGTTDGGAGGATGGAGGIAACPPVVPGVWQDLSGNGHDATLKNFGAGSGLVGSGTPADPYAMNFDGMDDYAELAPGADGLRLTTEATLEIWVNDFFAEGEGSYNNMYTNRNGPETSGFFGSIINPGNINNSQWYAGYSTDGTSWVQPFLTTPGLPPSNTWTHFVATFSVIQGLSHLYINGVAVDSEALTAPIVYSAASLPRVGGEVGGSNFRGKFGEIRIWSAALDANEVLARYQAGAPRYGIIAPSPTSTVTKPIALRLDATCQ